MIDKKKLDNKMIYSFTFLFQLGMNPLSPVDLMLFIPFLQQSTTTGLTHIHLDVKTSQVYRFYNVISFDSKNVLTIFCSFSVVCIIILHIKHNLKLVLHFYSKIYFITNHIRLHWPTTPLIIIIVIIIIVVVIAFIGYLYSDTSTSCPIRA